jgi:Flp pilus assembly protein TadB
MFRRHKQVSSPDARYCRVMIYSGKQWDPLLQLSTVVGVLAAFLLVFGIWTGEAAVLLFGLVFAFEAAVLRWLYQRKKRRHRGTQSEAR